MNTEGTEQRSVYALDNVRLELPVAAGGSRSLAAAIDYTALLLLFSFIFIAAILVATAFADSLPSGGWIAAGTLLTIFAVDFSFFFLQELFSQGQTVGKRLLGLRVVSNRGGRATATSLVLRNLVRTIDLFFGAWFLVLDPRARRIGDRIAGTMVIHQLPARSSGNAVQRAPAGWGPERIALVETLLERYETLPPERTAALARQILEHARFSDPSFSRAETGTPILDLMRAFGEANGETAQVAAPPAPGQP